MNKTYIAPIATLVALNANSILAGSNFSITKDEKNQVQNESDGGIFLSREWDDDDWD